jgi:DNA-binding transcriptional LysR family regulator
MQAAHRIPQDPAELEQHGCLLFRNPEGTVIDLWEFKRAGEKRSVAVGGWLVSNHRDVIPDAAVSREGVARLADHSAARQFRSGRLVQVLVNWEVYGAPPVCLLYRAADRGSSRLRWLIDSVAEQFGELDQERLHGLPAGPADRPQWYRRHYGRASDALRGRR